MNFRTKKINAGRENASLASFASSMKLKGRKCLLPPGLSIVTLCKPLSKIPSQSKSKQITWTLIFNYLNQQMEDEGLGLKLQNTIKHRIKEASKGL